MAFVISALVVGTLLLSGLVNSLFLEPYYINYGRITETKPTKIKVITAQPLTLNKVSVYLELL